MKSYSLWIDKKKQAKIYQKKLVYNKNNKTVLVKTIYSGISKGTEKLVSSTGPIWSLNTDKPNPMFSVLPIGVSKARILVFGEPSISNH